MLFMAIIKMALYTTQQRVQIIEFLYENYRSMKTAYIELHNISGQNYRSTESTIS